MTTDVYLQEFQKKCRREERERERDRGGGDRERERERERVRVSLQTFILTSLEILGIIDLRCVCVCVFQLLYL